jgi:DNA-binding Lrp family transcriptional regulator
LLASSGKSAGQLERELGITPRLLLKWRNRYQAQAKDWKVNLVARGTAARLTIELIYLLPNISGSELKILAAVLYNFLQVGGGEPTSLRDIEQMTGLSRTTVIATLDSLLAGQILERQAQGRSFIYIPMVKLFTHAETQPVKKFNHSKRTVKKFNHPETQMVKKFDRSGVQLVKNFNQLQPESEESDRELINDLSINDSLSDSLNSGSGKKFLLLQKLRASGVYLKTAQAIVNEHDVAAIEQQLKYYRYALLTNMAQGPGWLVQAIKENWPAPLGYEDPEENRFGSCPECGGPRFKNGYHHNLGCPDDRRSS